MLNSSNPRPHTLIVVCGHSIYIPHRQQSDPSPLIAQNWSLAPFQAPNPRLGKVGEHITFISHARTAIECWHRLARTQDEHTIDLGEVIRQVQEEGKIWQRKLYASVAAQPSPETRHHTLPSWDQLPEGERLEEQEGVFELNDLTDRIDYRSLPIKDQKLCPVLCFSGGRTKGPSLPSEAQSYVDALSILFRTKGHGGEEKLLGVPESHILLDEYSTDSFQNVLFPIICFRRRFGSYPRSIIVVTHEFKRPRFVNLHARALRLPHESFHVVGIDPPMTDLEREMTQASEWKHSYSLFEKDPFGLGDALFNKRLARHWKSKYNQHDHPDAVEEQTRAVLFGKHDEKIPNREAFEQETEHMILTFNRPLDHLPEKSTKTEARVLDAEIKLC